MTKTTKSTPARGRQARAAKAAARAETTAPATQPDEPASGHAPAAVPPPKGRARKPKEEPAAPPPVAPRGEEKGIKGKLGIVVGLLSRPEGVTVEALSEATGWQIHSVRGAMSGALKKQRGFTITSEKTDAGRIYRIPAPDTGSEASA